MTLILGRLTVCLTAFSLSACDVRSWDTESRIRFWEKQFLEGERALQKHSPSEAIDSLKNAIVESENLDQEHKSIRLAFTNEQLANAYLATKDYDNAEKSFFAALQIYEQLSTQNEAKKLLMRIAATA